MTFSRHLYGIMALFFFVGFVLLVIGIVKMLETADEDYGTCIYATSAAFTCEEDFWAIVDGNAVTYYAKDAPAGSQYQIGWEEQNGTYGSSENFRSRAQGRCKRLLVGRGVDESECPEVVRANAGKQLDCEMIHESGGHMGVGSCRTKETVPGQMGYFFLIAPACLMVLCPCVVFTICRAEGQDSSRVYDVSDLVDLPEYLKKIGPQDEEEAVPEPEKVLGG